MKKIDASLNEFLSTITSDFNGLVGRIELMKDNMSQLKIESAKSVNNLNQKRIELNAGGEQPTIEGYNAQRSG